MFRRDFYSYQSRGAKYLWHWSARDARQPRPDAKAARGEIAHFTGKDGSFEPPQNADLILDTESTSIEDAAFELLEAIRERITVNRPL